MSEIHSAQEVTIDAGSDVSTSASHDRHSYRLLEQLDDGNAESQRSLSKSLGIALGLTNLLLRKLVRKGWVRMARIKPNRVRYFLTPTGIAEKAEMSRRILQGNLRFYREARNRIRDQFAVLSAGWRLDGDAGSQHEKRIGFFGSGEVAEIGYVCLQETDLRLVGVVDDGGRDRFFDVPVHPVQPVRGLSIDGVSFGQLVVIQFGDQATIIRKLDALDVPEDRVFWV